MLAQIGWELQEEEHATDIWVKDDVPMKIWNPERAQDLPHNLMLKGLQEQNPVDAILSCIQRAGVNAAEIRGINSWLFYALLLHAHRLAWAMHENEDTYFAGPFIYAVAQIFEGAETSEFVRTTLE